MRRKSIRIVLSVLMVFVLLFGAVSCGKDDIKLSEGEVGKWQASWVRGYKSFDELCADKDIAIVAVGVIDRVVEVIKESERADSYITVFAFRIEKVLRGEEVREIFVYQLGSPDNPSSAFSDDPIFKVHERHLLFLIRNVRGHYSSIGPWGRYKVVDNKVYSLNYVLPNDMFYNPPESMDFDGVVLETFTQNAAEKLNAVR